MSAKDGNGSRVTRDEGESGAKTVQVEGVDTGSRSVPVKIIREQLEEMVALEEGLFRRVPQIPLPGMCGQQKRSGKGGRDKIRRIWEGRGHSRCRRRKAGICLCWKIGGKQRLGEAL